MDKMTASKKKAANGKCNLMRNAMKSVSVLSFSHSMKMVWKFYQLLKYLHYITTEHFEAMVCGWLLCAFSWISMRYAYADECIFHISNEKTIRKFWRKFSAYLCTVWVIVFTGIHLFCHDFRCFISNRYRNFFFRGVCVCDPYSCLKSILYYVYVSVKDFAFFLLYSTFAQWLYWLPCSRQHSNVAERAFWALIHFLCVRTGP